jgi:diguanylate cyclase (GGDEF)-like protein
MRLPALVGLVLSLVLGAIAVAVTLDDEHARRNEQDRALQAATSGETALISDGERQTATALSLMLVNPAVRALLDGDRLHGARDRGDEAATALALQTITHSSLVRLAGACLDDGAGRQLVCAPVAGAHRSFAPALGRAFAALARRAMVGAASGLFVSPVTGQLSVAFLAPFRVGGHLRGFVHLDISLIDTHGSTLIVNSTPGVDVRLASYERGRLLVDSAAGSAGSGAFTQASIPVGGFPVGAGPRPIVSADHRGIVAALPLMIGGEQRHLAVVAIATAANPDFFNSWDAGMLALLALSAALLIGSIAALVLSSRGVARELLTDPLTGLRNRRALMADLPRVCHSASEERPVFVWFFDLNGFKQYNDSFGHVAGDALLARLGARLGEAVRQAGTGYRLGGDEFCVVIDSLVTDPVGLFAEARAALTEQGRAFTVTASAGAVELPREAADPTQALRLADRRMYREKAVGRTGGAELITAVLQAALAQRHPDLGEHSNDVAGDVRMLAHTIGLDEATTNLVVKAGDLHDIGKLGIPDEILSKPGPLNDHEWEFMKRHTLMGEQILAAGGPSLEQIAPLVRSSHERWDGTGYPDGLAGEQIPLGARIIAICDSFRAMIDERPYKRAMSMEEALDELRRCAGTQFDPHLVAVFCRLVETRSSSEQLVAAA